MRLVADQLLLTVPQWRNPVGITAIEGPGEVKKLLFLAWRDDALDGKFGHAGQFYRGGREASRETAQRKIPAVLAGGGSQESQVVGRDYSSEGEPKRFRLMRGAERSQDEVERLVKVCKTCTHYVKGRCGLCRCKVNSGPAIVDKIRMATENCPADKWVKPPDPVDVVYTLSSESRWHDNELRYSRRASASVTWDTARAEQVTPSRQYLANYSPTNRGSSRTTEEQ